MPYPFHFFLDSYVSSINSRFFDINSRAMDFLTSSHFYFLTALKSLLVNSIWDFKFAKHRVILSTFPSLPHMKRLLSILLDGGGAENSLVGCVWENFEIFRQNRGRVAPSPGPGHSITNNQKQISNVMTSWFQPGMKFPTRLARSSWNSHPWRKSFSCNNQSCSQGYAQHSQQHII